MEKRSEINVGELSAEDLVEELMHQAEHYGQQINTVPNAAIIEHVLAGLALALERTAEKDFDRHRKRLTKQI